MLARFVLGASFAIVTASAAMPAMAGQTMNADEARRFVAGKVFAFRCFDGTRGAGRILDEENTEPFRSSRIDKAKPDVAPAHHQVSR